MALIEVHDLTKQYRVPNKSSGFTGAVKHLLRPHFEEKIAIDGIDFAIDEGESVAYVGPNGAGKSTTVKILTGILVPTDGSVKVRGLIPYHQRIQNARNIGVVFGQRTQLWWDLPVQEALRLLGDIYEVPKTTFERNLKLYIDILELEPLLKMPARQLSLGQRMRCDLAAALIHSPRILYLDEPTIGLDVAVKQRIREFIKRINHEDGATVMLTSHDLGDIEDLCRRLIMIDKGKIVFDGPLHELKERFGRERVMHLMLSETMPEVDTIVQAVLAALPTAVIKESDPHQLSIQFDARQITAAAIANKLMPVLPVNDLRIEESSIESIIRQLYEGRLSIEELKV